ncbi:MAG: GLPGLI family protein [Bacteroidota bacterium]
MKKVLFALCLIFPLALSAQVLQGEILYEDKSNLHKNLRPDQERFKAFIPEFRADAKLLKFTEGVSLYVAGTDEDQETIENRQAAPEGGRRRWRGWGGGADDKLYKNLDEATKIDQREFFTKFFLISGDLEEYQWKMTGEQKMVANYICMRAVHSDSTKEIEAWFTIQIPVSTGPDIYGQLPGLIMELNLNRGERVIKAVEVRKKEIDLAQMKKPTKGKDISREDYENMVKEKMAEMQQNAQKR